MSYVINTSVGFFTIRGLKHREVKTLDFRKRVGSSVGEESDKLQEDVLLAVVGQENMGRLDDLVAYERTALFSKIIDLTFMTDDQRKNFNWRWDSTMPEPMTPVPTAEKPVSNEVGDVQTSAADQT